MQLTHAPTPPRGALARWKDCWHARLSGNVHFPLPLTPVRVLKAQVEPRELALYERLLPVGLGMPKQPMLQLEMLEARPGWREGSVSMRCTYGDVEGWHGLYWPIDDYVGYKLGRLVGYPKFMAQRMRLTLSPDGARGEVVHAGRTQMALELCFDRERDPPHTVSRQSMLDQLRPPELERDYYLLVPPAVGPSLNRLAFSEVVKMETRLRDGHVRFAFDVDEPWTALLPAETAGWPGKLIERRGLGFGWLVAKRVQPIFVARGQGAPRSAA